MDTLRREIKGAGIGVYPIGLGAMPLSIAGRPAEAQAFEVIAGKWNARPADDPTPRS